MFNKIPKAFIKDDLFLPLWDDRFVLLEVERLSHDGKNVVHVLFLIKRGDMPMAMKNKDRHFIKQKYKNTETECTQLEGRVTSMYCVHSNVLLPSSSSEI